MDINFVSFPRSGSHFIKYVFQDYLGGYLDDSVISSYIAHDHDIYLQKKYVDTLYVYRNKLDVVYSWYMAENFNEVENFIKEDILNYYGLVSEHQNYYKYNSKLIYDYESLTQGINENWINIFNFFGITDPDANKLESVLSNATKTNYVTRSLSQNNPYNVYDIQNKYMNEFMLSQKYKDMRIEFHEIFGYLCA